MDLSALGPYVGYGTVHEPRAAGHAQALACSFSSMSTWDQTFSQIVARGATLAPGLSPRELDDLTAATGLAFPPDLASFLSIAVPVGRSWPTWRDTAQLQSWIDGPLDGIIFDVEHNGFWWPAWGARPIALEDAFALTRRHFSAVPPLTPVYGHRYLLADPLVAGNPVFSVHQTDVIYYGADLTRYFEAEFGGLPHAVAVRGAAPVSFWGELGA